MPKIRVYNLGSLNLKVSPFLHKEGELIRSLNVETDMFGAKKKRPGYGTYLGTPDNDTVQTLFNWRQNSGTQFWNYRASGSVLYYSTQGTGAWTTCGNGTITDGTQVVHAVLEDTLVISQDAGTTRHSTDGTSFTNTSAAPVAVGLAEYQNRIWAGGTQNSLFYSTTGTPSDWTSDSSSINIPGPGRINSVFKANDRLVVSKNSGEIHRYDGFNLVDLATDLGPTSPYSVGEVEDYRIYLNRRGFYGYGGGKPEIISNSIERQVYNDSENGIQGTTFDDAPAVIHYYDYLCSVGTVTDDFTDETVSDCVMKYDYQLNEWCNFSFANRPYSLCSYRDNSGKNQLIFGDSSGQCYTFGGTNISDNGSKIDSFLEGILHFGSPELDKKFNFVWAFTNPGSQAKVQVAITDTFTKRSKNWVDLKQTRDGVMEAKFPAGSRGKLLFWKVYEASRDSRFHFYGFTVDADFIERK